MNRTKLLAELQRKPAVLWDVLVIGGGATGLGVAVDAAARGYKTLLLEQSDFAQSTSSRSTKLMHGGVRYLAQGDVFLVMEALHERSRMHQNAPHLTRNQEFVIPIYTWWDAIQYTIGLKLYDLLAGRLSMGKSHFISRDKAMKRLPLLKKEGLKGGVIYHDGQFDDARFAVALAQSCAEKGGVPLNYFKVTNLLKNSSGKVQGVNAKDLLSGKNYSISAKTVINATGVFADEVLALDTPGAKPTIRPSQGVHLVLDRSFLQSDSAVMIPKTDDGRVLFTIPWYDKVVVGTTDTPIDQVSHEPRALKEEVDFILQTAGKYLTRPPKEKDILCVFAGLRPLAAPTGDSASTKEISRRHKITVSASGLISILGGKWTIYRRMAQDTLGEAIKRGFLPKTECSTQKMKIFGATNEKSDDPLRVYGSNADNIREMIKQNPELGNKIHPSFPFTKAEIIWICRNEMPCKLEDILARRTRALILDAGASEKMAPEVVEIMAEEFGYNDEWKQNQLFDYHFLLENYLNGKILPKRNKKGEKLSGELCEK